MIKYRKKKKKKSQREILKDKLTVVFNKFIRLRDQNLPCISCGVNRVQHAGHYWPVSQYPQGSMRFNPDNVNGQCVNCNSFEEGNRQGYEKGLIRRFGKKILGRLDIQRSLPQVKWDEWELDTMIVVYKEKIKQLEASNE